MSTIQDTQLAFRLLRRTPSTTVVAVVSIALSVAATAVVFAAIQAVLIKPLPYAHPERLIQIGSDFGSKSAPSIVDFGFWNDAQEIARRTRTLESVAAYGNVIFDLSGDGSTPSRSPLWPECHRQFIPHPRREAHARPQHIVGRRPARSRQ